MKKNLLFIFLSAIAFASCKKDNSSGGTAAFTTDKTSYYLKQNVILSNNSTGAEKYSWNFGDGTSSTLQSPSHNYAAGGNYKITLTVNGHSTASTSIKIFNGEASFEIDNLSSFDFPLFTYTQDSSQVPVDFQQDGLLKSGEISDTTFTSNTQIFIGGTSNGQSFIIFAPYTIKLFTNTILTFNNNTKIVLDNLKPGQTLSQLLKSITPSDVKTIKQITR